GLPGRHGRRRRCWYCRRRSREAWGWTLREKHFAGGDVADAVRGLAQDEGAGLVDAFEHAARLPCRQPRADARAQSCRAGQPRIADRREAATAPHLIPPREMGGEMKQGVVRRRYSRAQGPERGRWKFGP